MIGTVMALLGLVIGGYSALVVRQVDLKDIKEDVDYHETAFVEEVDSMSLEKLYDEWKMVSKQPPGTAGTSFSLHAESFVDYWMTVATVSFVAAALGILLAGGSLVGRRR